MPLYQHLTVGQLFPIDDQANHQLTRPIFVLRHLLSGTDQHMTHQTAVRLLIIRLHLKLLHPADHDAQDLFIDRMAQIASGSLNDRVSATGVKTGNDTPLFIAAHGELGFIAIPKGMLHPNGRQYRRILKATDPF